LIKRKETASNERESINLEISRLDATDANLDKYRADSESKMAAIEGKTIALEL
jgi:hypothetical protein